MSYVRGKDFKLYVNTDSPYDNSPTWVENTNVKDLTRNLSAALADVSTRGTTYRLQDTTLLDLSIDWQAVYDAADTILSELETAFHTNGYVELLFLDGSIATTGSRGLRGMFKVSKFQGNEALEDEGLIDVSVVPAYYSGNMVRRVSITAPNTITNT